MHWDGGTTELDGAMHGRVPARPFTCVRCGATQLGLLSKDTSASSYKSRSANCCHGLAHSGQQIVVEERTTFFISILGSDGLLKFYFSWETCLSCHLKRIVKRSGVVFALTGAIRCAP